MVKKQEAVRLLTRIYQVSITTELINEIVDLIGIIQFVDSLDWDTAVDGFRNSQASAPECQPSD